MSVEIQTAIEAIAANEWSAVVVQSDGSIVAVIGVDSIPSIEKLKEITDKYPECAFQFLSRGNLSPEQVKEVIRGLVGALEYSETHEMRPGVNIPRKEEK